jgi:hypothetical protein
MTQDGWIRTTLVCGHGVASGRSTTSPYPEGTIAMQRPLFAQLGLDLSDCWPGTLNLSVAPLEVQLRDPDHTFPHLHWTDLHPPKPSLSGASPSNQLLMTRFQPGSITPIRKRRSDTSSPDPWWRCWHQG